ncbi:MAG: hypothetical protein ACP5C4_05445 [Methanomicrobiales archaeon]
MNLKEEKVQDYLELVPTEVRDATSGLSNDTHWAVFIALLENDEMWFTQIKSEFGLESTQLVRILRDLGRAGLVQQYTSDLREIKSRARSFYRVTPIGRDFIESLMDRFLPCSPATYEYGMSGPLSATVQEDDRLTPQGESPSTGRPYRMNSETYCAT